jgi:Brp/Blh family beta-carotene 15,15'-monooxygenase
MAFVAAVIMLIILHQASPWSPAHDTTLALALVAIILAGLPHGALDIHIALNSRMRDEASSRFDILWLYVGIGLVGGVSWLIAPAYLVALFLVLSIWHFSGDFKALGRPVAVLVATSILLTPIVSYPIETRNIFAMLMPFEDAALLVRAAGWAWPIILATMLGLIWRGVRAPVIALAGSVAIIAGVVFSPIVAFALYFCLLHSPTHIRTVLLDSPLIFSRLKEALFYTGLTFGMLAGMFILWSVLGAGAPLTGAVFGLLIVLTLPHMAIVEHWQQS